MPVKGKLKSRPLFKSSRFLALEVSCYCSQYIICLKGFLSTVLCSYCGSSGGQVLQCPFHRWRWYRSSFFGHFGFQLSDGNAVTISTATMPSSWYWSTSVVDKLYIPATTQRLIPDRQKNVKSNSRNCKWNLAIFPVASVMFSIYWSTSQSI